ncbi:rRNA-processing protein utp23-like [Teratosphaeria destructans]|uniref:U three protein 23 n=1 Tax=Teratosphaeria destructans TaxID=418781 RepID=A0A9W7SJA8_9PEZI|nr:rRNA-processing protein utp23-like [Teratosphaeria destructans]
MGAKRQKQYRKLMQQYAMHFGFRSPYQVLLTADLIATAAKCRMNLGNMLEKTLQQKEIKPMITQCSIRHLYDLETRTPQERAEKEGLINVAKAAERRRCGHHELEKPLSELECLMSVVDPKGSGNNKHRYIVATQDLQARKKLRQVAGVPLVYINRSVMILEPMAGKTEDMVESEEKMKIRAGLKSQRPAPGSGAKRKREDDEEAEEVTRPVFAGTDVESGQAQKKRKVKGPKGPNPLSVKKAKKEKPGARQAEDERGVIRKATKSEPKAAEKALGAEAATTASAIEGETDGPRKRKRKRKPKDGDAEGGAQVGAADGEDD